MAAGQMNAMVCCLRRAALPVRGGNLSDGRLLGRFLAAGDEQAFEVLVRRHGPMVLGVCRRILHGFHDAEDAFQATFLVLVRKAATLVGQAALGNWLYGVAYRTAQKARVAAARRRAKEKQMARPEALGETGDQWRELRSLIDQELSRLPDKYRAPVVLCDLEGQSRKEAARRLGCPEGTVSGRLARARVLLAQRLARRGLALSAPALALALASAVASAAVPVPLVGSTVKAAALIAAGPPAAAAVSAPVAALTEGVLQTMGVSKRKVILATLLAIGMVAAGWGVYQGRADDTAPPTVNPSEPAIAAPAPASPAKPAEKINLPTGPAPIQVLASVNSDGKLVIKTAAMGFVQIAPPRPLPPQQVPPVPPRLLPGAGGPAPAIAIAPFQPFMQVHSQNYDFNDVQVLNTKGKKLTRKEVMKQLKEETVAVASQWGQPADPLHLRVLKDGILVFVLPAPRGMPGLPGVVPPGVPVPLPAPLPIQPGVPGAAPGGFGIALPGQAQPGIPTTPPAPPPVRP
jgi:RNA polymerase sigma factor (sigma-70 family)